MALISPKRIFLTITIKICEDTDLTYAIVKLLFLKYLFRLKVVFLEFPHTFFSAIDFLGKLRDNRQCFTKKIYNIQED